MMATCRIVIRHFEAPAITADSIKRLSLTETATDRVILFTLGKLTTAMARITFTREVPKTDMIIIANTIAGIAKRESMNLWINESILPPTKALKIPRRPPATDAKATPVLATMREIREP